MPNLFSLRGIKNNATKCPIYLLLDQKMRGKPDNNGFDYLNLEKELMKQFGHIHRILLVSSSLKIRYNDLSLCVSPISLAALYIKTL